MNWIALTDPAQLDQIVAASQLGPVAIFKHSTRCSVSIMVKRGLDRQWPEQAAAIPGYYLDLLNHRDISNAIAERFGIRHESPQLLLLHHGRVSYHASHSEIDLDEMVKAA